MRHRIAAAIYDGLLGFEYGVAREILGRDRTNLTPDWYEFLPCRVEPGRLFSSHGLEVQPEGELTDLARADTILISGWREPHHRPCEPFLDALVKAHHRGARLVSICTGVFPLAHSGVLNGRSATTHWLHVDELSRCFPEINVERDALYLDDDAPPASISTSAGSSAGIDLCLAVVRQDFGVRIANTIARRMVAPVHRDGGQSQYSEALPASSEDEGFGAVLDWVADHLHEPLRVDVVARKFGFSLRTLQRRFKELTSLSPHQWLVQQRVARARELLEVSDKSVEHVATQSGLGSAANLRKHLARYLGTTPRAYRSAFRTEH